MVFSFISLLVVSALALRADAGEWDIAYDVELQSRYFVESAQWYGQNEQGVQAALSSTFEARWQNSEKSQRVAIVTHGRWDAIDSERSLLDLRESYWAIQHQDLELLIGINTVFWGVTESAHIVDVINQTDLVSDIDGEDKLGQPMINLAWQKDWGLLNFYLLPGFRERTFPGIEGRLRTPIPVEQDRAQYESSREEKHLDLALRYSHYIGDFDLGLSLFSGTSRDPRFIVEEGGDALIPVYDQIDQLGMDLQYTKDAWLWKLETTVKKQRGENFWSSVGGFEYTQYQLFDRNADLGYLMEYQYDDRDENMPTTLADNDIFLALRLTLNDAQDTAILAGWVYDHKTDEMFYNIEADRRVGDNIKVSSRLRFFQNAEPDEANYAFQRDDYFQLSLAYYF